MSKSFETLVQEFHITAENLETMTGVSNRNARAWLTGEKHVPEPALRLILVVLGEESPEKYKP